MVSKHVPPEQLGSLRLIERFAFVALSPLVNRTYPVIVYLAPACNIPLIATDGPPVPVELVLVSRLYEPEYAAAFVATGVVAPKNDTQPSAVPSSKLYVATTCALMWSANNSMKTST